jgi:hypothetical protein
MAQFQSTAKQVQPAAKTDAEHPAEARGAGQEARVPRAVSDEATQKAERDRRYAERKARKR